MSITTRMGRRIVAGEKRRIKKQDEVEERSRHVYEMLCEGHAPDLVAGVFSITRRHVNRLVARMPPSVKKSIRLAVARERRARLEDMAERLEAS